ncbi:Pre-mRNA-splicing factor SPF27 [Podospora aff. communis PSN243]|uniref:Pre-mRNA-splicing factor SPF27 n=1 Tax=Podospora aff. communis PSN243 TaxID=3040156 RepID=A0AAV9GVR4_9PEZI|nr:Pre-mRNA-splicing factor SPF27 [Podospora aff. communis PSN243]
MPSITTIHESLPYIDPEPTPSALSAAHALIAAERALVPDDPHHALLPPPPTSNFTPILAAEHTRLAADPTSKISALDLTRYEAPTATTSTSPTELSTLLSRAYASHAYVSSRRAHLALLDTYGKNAWLIGNWQLEGELKAIEKELAETKRAIDVVTLQRKGAQDTAGPEIQGLEETWRRGVARVLETEAAAEALRREILEAKRQAEP